MDQPYEREREVAVRALRQAAALGRGVLDPEALAKADRTPVTVADFGSQALIGRALAEAFPDDPVRAEEDSADLYRPEAAGLLDQVLRHVRAIRPEADGLGICRWIDHGEGRGYAERSWALDPIDGTKGFLRGGQYAIALALIVGGRVQVAAMACPNLPLDAGSVGPLGVVFVAVRGHGASALPLDGDGPARPIRVSPRFDPASARPCEPFEAGHSARDAASAVAARLGVTAPPLRLDSQAKYALVARGKAEIYLRVPRETDGPAKVWDHAAGALVAEEAGGRVTDLAGRPLDFAHGHELTANRGLVVTNGPLHGRVLAALEAVGLSSR